MISTLISPSLIYPLRGHSLKHLNSDAQSNKIFEKVSELLKIFLYKGNSLTCSTGDLGIVSCDICHCNICLAEKQFLPQYSKMEGEMGITKFLSGVSLSKDHIPSTSNKSYKKAFVCTLVCLDALGQRSPGQPDGPWLLPVTSQQGTAV